MINIKITNPSIIAHYGVSVKDGAPGRGSGRYPLGSGERPRSEHNPWIDSNGHVIKRGATKTETKSFLKDISKLPSSDKVKHMKDKRMVTDEKDRDIISLFNTNCAMMRICEDYFHDFVYASDTSGGNICNKLRKLGYDGMIDLEDASGQTTPMILFDINNKMQALKQ